MARSSQTLTPSFSKVGDRKIRFLPLRCQRCGELGNKKNPVRYYHMADLCQKCIDVLVTT